MQKLLTINEVAEILGIARGSLYNMISERHIECVKIGSRVRFDEECLKRYIEKNRQKAE